MSTRDFNDNTNWADTPLPKSTFDNLPITAELEPDPDEYRAPEPIGWPKPEAYDAPEERADDAPEEESYDAPEPAFSPIPPKEASDDLQKAPQNRKMLAIIMVVLALCLAGIAAACVNIISKGKKDGAETQPEAIAAEEMAVAAEESVITIVPETEPIAEAILTLDMPEMISADNFAGSIEIAWNPVENATGYVVYKRTYTGGWGEWQELAIVTDTMYKDKDVEENTSYRYTVQAVNDAGVASDYDETGLYERFMKRPVIKEMSSDRGGVFKVRWTKREGVSGYVIRYSRSEDFSENAHEIEVPDAAATSQTVEKMKWGATYYVTVRSYKISGERVYYSAWSKPASVDVKGK